MHKNRTNEFLSLLEILSYIVETSALILKSLKFSKNNFAIASKNYFGYGKNKIGKLMY